MVVPVYNVEEYIEQCILSVLNQDFSDYELLVVDDQSPCGSIKLVEDIFSRYGFTRGRIIHREKNGGLGAARNTGIKAAKGKYILFLDSDDWLAEGALSAVIKKAVDTRADLVAFDFLLSYPLKEVPQHTFKNCAAGEERKFILNYNPCAWNKLYLRSVFTEEQFFFPEERQWYEDVATIPMIMSTTKKVAVLQEPLIHYRQRSGSIMDETRKGNPKLFDIFTSARRVIENRRMFTKPEWIELETNLIFHCGVARLGDILQIEDRKVKLAFLERLFNELEDMFPAWRTSHVFLSHHNNFTGKQRDAWRRAISAFTKGKLKTTAHWSKFLGKTEEGKKKLFFAIPTLDVGGGEKVLVNLLQRFDKSRFDITLYVYERTGPLESFLDGYGIRIIHRNSYREQLYLMSMKSALTSNISLSNKALKVMMAISKRVMGRWTTYRKFVANRGQLEPGHHFDAAVSFVELHPEMLSFVLDQVNADRKFLWIHNDFKPNFIDYIDDHFFEQLYKRFDRIVAVSSGAAKSLRDRFKSLQNKVDKINNVLDIDNIISKSSAPIQVEFDPSSVNLISVGRLSFTEKGFDRIIPAAVRLKKDNFNFKWYVVGSGPHEGKMKELIEENGLGDTVILLGQQLNPYPFIKKADAYVLPSRFEAYPTVVLEAHTLRVPCIVMENSGSEDQFREVKEMVLRNTDEELYRGLHRFLSDEALRKEMKTQVAEFVYDNDKIVSQMEELLLTGKVRTAEGIRTIQKTDGSPAYRKHTLQELEKA